MSTLSNDAGAHRLCGPEPLFPHDAVPEHANIRVVRFCERRTDGQLLRPDHLDANKMRCWDDVKRVLGPGLYRAVGMDEQGRVVAMSPAQDGWVAIVPGAEPFMMPDSAIVVPAPAAAAPPPMDSTMRAWFEADTERVRATTEYIRRQSAWMDMLFAMIQSPAAGRPNDKPN